MVDFRYHLVSLVSVFMALAVGIVLGAGPLKAPIGDSLQSQVDSLRTDRDKLRQDGEVKDTHLKDDSDFIIASAPRLLKGTLKGKTIALVRTQGVDSKLVDALENRLGEAGAKVVQAMTLTDKTLDEQAATDLTGQLHTLDSSLPDDAAQAVPQAMARAVGFGSGSAKSVDANKAAELQKALGNAGLIRAGDTAKANGVLVVLPQQDTAGSEESSAALDVGDGADLSVDVASLLPSVAAAPERGDQDGQLATLRSKEQRLTTVDSLGQATGPVIVSLALADVLGGGRAGAYGFGTQASRLAPGFGR
ncbi:copper transporter [Brevibacterium sp. 50QC2O2]|uniref:copper transporter n=1 Tax=Brevibacterium TaxID=1696 RepID=UPI00211B989E|nr:MULTISPECIES: copper transporter [unclassified Brevibacterium]MCQ9384237.1 copper transporter [Brevibacterium sp. 68QC2CO]MCQ9388284.1 copper transporter [Brevibacterium sp. 50QC2O2]